MLILQDEIERLNANLSNISYELLAARKKVEFIDSCRETIWRDGFEEAMGEAEADVKALEAMRTYMLLYYDRFTSIDEDTSFTTSQELLHYGIKATMIKEGIDGKSDVKPCFKDENELKLDYRQAKEKIDKYRKTKRYLRPEIDYIESLLFFTYATFMKYTINRENVVKQKAQNGAETLKKTPSIPKA